MSCVGLLHLHQILRRVCVGQDGEPDGIHLEKHLQSMRNQASGGAGGKGGWKSQIEDLNEAVTEHVEIGAEALAEMGGGEQPLAWKPRQARL